MVKRLNLKESGMYDYYDTSDNVFNTHDDMSTEEDDWLASIPSSLRSVVHEMEERGWEGVGFTTTGVSYCISTEDRNRPELSYEICVDIYDGDDSIYIGKYVDIFDWDKEKQVSSIPNTSGVTEFRTPQDVKKFTQWFKRLGTSFSTKESVKVRNIKQTIDEGVAASLLTIKNQLMNKLGSAFKSIGGSMNPKVTVYREDDPDTSFDITTDGKNVDIVPKYDGIPDTVHKKRGIAFMRAVNVLYDFIMDTLSGGKKLATESKIRKASKRSMVESAAEKDLYDDLYSYADQYRMTSRWTKANVEKYLERQKNFRRMSDTDFQKVVDKVNKDFKRKKKVKSFPYDSNSYKTESIRRKRLKEDSLDTSNPYSYENLESDAKRCFKQGNYIVSDVIYLLFRNWYKKKEIYKIIMANLDMLDLGKLDDESFIEQEIEDQAMMY